MNLQRILILLPFCFGLSVSAKPKEAKKVKTFSQTISVKMIFSGDLAESYQFDGPLGDRLLGAAEKPDSECENKTLFRQVLYRQKKHIEVWIDLVCLPKGQTPEKKIEFKPYRIFIDPTQPSQTVELPSLSEKLKKVSVSFQDLQIKSGKSK